MIGERDLFSFISNERFFTDDSIEVPSFLGALKGLSAIGKDIFENDHSIQIETNEMVRKNCLQREDEMNDGDVTILKCTQKVVRFQ